jgi:protein SCO1/2
MKQIVAAICAALAMTSTGTPVRGAVDPVRATLIDQAGHAFSFAQLRGAPVAVTFVATRCKDECPLVNAWFVRLQRELERKHVGAMLLTITLDPRYDTPRVMAAQAQALGANPRVWRFASGSVPSIDAILAAFRVHVEPDEHGIPDIHSTFVYILNPRGKIAAFELPSASIVEDTVAALRAQTGR